MLFLRARIGSMLNKGGNSIGNVGVSGENGIYENPYGTLLCFHINFGGEEFRGRMGVEME